MKLRLRGKGLKIQVAFSFFDFLEADDEIKVHFTTTGIKNFQ